MTPDAVVSFAVETNEALDPIAIRTFRAQAVMLHAQRITHPIKQFFGLVR